MRIQKDLLIFTVFSFKNNPHAVIQKLRSFPQKRTTVSVKSVRSPDKF